MEQRRATLPRPVWLATVQSALTADLLLGSQAVGALAGLACAGLVEGLVLALLVDGERSWAGWGLVLLAGLLPGLANMALAVRDRRHLQRLRRGQRRYFGALGLLCLGTAMAAVALNSRPLWVAGVVIVVAALVSVLAAQRAR